MFRASSSAPRVASSLLSQPSLRTIRQAQIPLNRRLASTAPNRPGTWRGFLVRLGLAGGVVYYYNTSDLFQPQPVVPLPSQEPPALAPPQTIESITAAKQKRAKSLYDDAPDPSSAGDATVATTASASTTGPPLGSETPVAAGGAAALEAEAGQQGAFNPETGEINWDCPCLGGMAHGPCGEQFRAAFSCFVFSEEDPKGMDCIDKFKGMQDCFREHPDIYGAELEDDDDETPDASAAEAAAKEATKPAEQVAAEKTAAKQQEAVKEKVAEKKDELVDRAQRATEQAQEAAARGTAKAKKAASDVQAQASKAGDAVSETVKQTKEAVKDTAEVAAKKVEEQVKKI